ncbi:OprD family porin [Endozoicomonas sp. Mp262]|uniref:OprD family porin n=1 Tax=Endozoicomonas sp. Mp262 TaxID=2919499 RepID=UPI0021D8427B
MHSFKKSALTCAVAALTLGSQIASANFSNLYEDASVSGKLRVTHYDIQKSDKADNSSSAAGATTGGLMLDAKSGYAWDIIGFDASLYSAVKLRMDENNSHSNQLLNDDNKGFSKIGQAYVKVKLGNDDLNGKLQAGRQIIYNGLISSSGSRTVPSSWQGYNLTGNAFGVSYGLAYVDQMSLRSEAGFHKLENFDGKRIDYVMGGQLGYKIGGLDLMYRNAFSKDFLQAHNFNAAYTFNLAENTDLTVGGRYFVTKEDGDLWTGTTWDGDTNFNDKAQNFSLNAKLAMNDWTVVAAVSKTKAEYNKAGELGKYYYDFGKNTHGIWGLETSGFAEDFMYDGETAWMAGAQYDFANLGVKGLNVGYFFHYGSGMELNNKKLSEEEHDLLVTYAFQQESLKGLSFKMKYGLYRTNDKELRDYIGYGKRDDLRVWLDYKFVAF